MKKQHFHRNGGIKKKHLSFDQKVMVLKQLGTKPSKLRIQTMAQQYNISSSTIMNWIEKGLWTQIPSVQPELDFQLNKSKLLAQRENFIELDETDQNNSRDQKKEIDESQQNLYDQIEIIL
ncbi:unnamed protein product (macronuclear) [Paramecium tetraurelia]|uniref:HTH psq-type domain-containing protein n=1 Tax=Paramecium tetraurelia TaxID=5888 RepID=A0BP83_PARTE|nr:uncharacterized protein GSPATT00005099001 [Paramecium tetraurelia]CAK60350.1 unnamed protein product [Paramecium tetraurelia]|eukprot:XP_001427748.1 hypothetical protein (macronuclear) [Paramecium tetraurelia strain d4-2]